MAVLLRYTPNSSNPLPSSLYRMVERYMVPFAQAPFVVDGIEYRPPDETVITHRTWRQYTCPPNCGACCLKYQLVFFPDEFKKFRKAYPAAAKDFREVIVETEVGGKTFVQKYWHDSQDSNADTFCKHLDQMNGRCGIHTHHPFHCAIELLRVLHWTVRGRDVVHIGTQKFGRNWKMRRLDGQLGTLCEILPPSPTRIAEILSHFQYLVHWMDLLHIPVLPAFRSFEFHPRMLRLNVVLSKMSQGIRYQRPAEEVGDVPFISDQQLVQIRPKSFMRVEQERVVESQELPKRGIFKYL